MYVLILDLSFFRSCASSLCTLDLPGDSQNLVQEFAFDMRTNCMFTLLKQAIAGKIFNLLFCRLLIFFKINFFKKFFQGYQ